jgi:hypothetical protein
MGRHKSTGRIELSGVFRHMQSAMITQAAAGDLIDQPTSCGAITERQWLDLLARYLPQRYCASSAFIVDSEGCRSRQIDIAVYDRLYSPLIFPQADGLHVAAESVYAVFEVKHELTAKWIADAGKKAASVRALHRTSVPVLTGGCPKPAIVPPRILAGVLAPRAAWARFRPRLEAALRRLSPDEALDLGCVLGHGSFEITRGQICFSTTEEALSFFILRLLERLRALGTAPAADLMAYGRSLESFRGLLKEPR